MHLPQWHQANCHSGFRLPGRARLMALENLMSNHRPVQRLRVVSQRCWLQVGWTLWTQRACWTQRTWLCSRCSRSVLARRCWAHSLLAHLRE